MITNTGRTILAKYLIGQAPAYASHISLGVGAVPLDELTAFGDYSEKQKLDFEVLRIPITSRGYVYDEAGAANIVFAGELPGDQRYLFSEVGIFSAKSNPAAGAQDSKMIYTFSESENWEYHNALAAVGIDTKVAPLNGAIEESIINPLDINEAPIPVFRTNSDNQAFNSDTRTSKFELPRFLETALLVSGNMSYLESDGTTLSVKAASAGEYWGTHIHLTGISPNFNKNSPQDQLLLAFSIMDKSADQTISIEEVRIMMEFASSDNLDPENFARFQAAIAPGQVDDVVASAVNFNTNRYYIAKNSLGDLVKSTAFTWDIVNSLKIYLSVIARNVVSFAEVSGNVATLTISQSHGISVGDIVEVADVGIPYDGEQKITAIVDDKDLAEYSISFDLVSSDSSGAVSGVALAPSSKFYAALDGFRLENITSQNPLYGLTGYSVIRTETGQPIIKEPNTSNLVEFRYGMDVA